jgi:F0F1-type ATP synthase assembly protein I
MPLPKQPNSFLKYSNMAFQLAIPIALGAWRGNKLDAYFQNKTPVFTIVLSLAGIAGGLYLVLKDLINPKEK